jgi:hypothetical protein
MRHHVATFINYQFILIHEDLLNIFVSEGIQRITLRVWRQPWQSPIRPTLAHSPSRRFRPPVPTKDTDAAEHSALQQ